MPKRQGGMPMSDRITFRKMTVRDIENVLLIERQAFTSPWSRNAFYGELTENHFARYIVMMMGDEMIGYGGMWIIIDEAHVTNVAVVPAYHGKKLGERLFRHLMAEAIARGARKMTLEVRVSNDKARGLYQKMGFLDGGIRRGYYTDNQEDALVMYRDLPSIEEEKGSNG